MLRHKLTRDTYWFKIVVITALILFSAEALVSAQQTRDEKPPLRERLFYGGSLGLQFGTITDIQVTPMIGLWLRPRVAIAAGPNYRYYKDPFFSTSLYGGNAYVQYYPLKDLNNVIPVGIHLGLYVHLEDELLSLESAVWDQANPYTRFLQNTVLGGFGISQQIGQRSAMNLTFLWALNNTILGLYSNPEIRISFNF